MIEEIVGRHANPGYSTENEHRIILKYLGALETDYPVVEIGIWEGVTTSMMADFLQLNGRSNKVIGIDTFETYTYEDEMKLASPIEIATRALESFPNTQIIQGHSDDRAVIDQVDKVSLIFFDGNHTYSAVQRDIEFWMPKVQEYALFHDYTFLPGVKRAVDESVARGILTILEVVDTIAVCQRS